MEENVGTSQNLNADNTGDRFASIQTKDKPSTRDTQMKGCSMTESMEGVSPGQSGEGAITKQIESVTSKIPSATFLSLAMASIGISALLQVFGRKSDAQFVGQWVPTILTLGLYNKLVKLEGSE